MDGDQAQAQAILSDMTEVNCTYVLRVTKATASIDGSFNSLSCNCDSQTRLLEGLMPNQPLFKFRKTQLSIAAGRRGQNPLKSALKGTFY